MIINKKSAEELYIEFILNKRPPNYIVKIFKDDNYKEKFFKQAIRFKKNLAEADISENEFNQYFNYQIYRFQKVNFLPSFESLANEKSITKYLKVRKYLPNLISKKNQKEFNKQSIIDTALYFKSSEVKERTFLLEEKQKRNFFKREGEKEIFSFCIFSSYFYNKKSNICQNCNQNIKCKKRNCKRKNTNT